MTSDEFKAWRRSHSFTLAHAGQALGLPTTTVLSYELGSRQDDDRPVVIPRTVALACAAISHGLKPIGET